MARTVAEWAKAFALRRVLRYVNRDFDKNGMKVVDWLIRNDWGEGVKHEAQLVKDALSNPTNNWSQLMRSLWTDIDDGQRLRLFENFVINGCMIGTPRQRKNSEKHGCNIPWAVLMYPTSACNLHCTGCWAAEYGDKLSMSLD